MKKNMHAKTLSIVLATTTVLQLTGTASQLLKGIPFVTANATVSGSQDISNTNVGITDTTSQTVTTTPAQVASTTPASVVIKGTERVGKTLEARLLKADSTEFTTSAGVTYKWYRLDNRNDAITDGKLVGEHKTYKLVSNDKDDYIKLIATYNGASFTDITEDIDKKSSSSHHDDDDDDDDTSKNNNSTATGFVKNSDGTFKIVENGRPVVGWKQMNGVWYLADSTGIMQTGWRQSNGNWYLLKNDGAMATGWQQEGGNWYLLNNNGAMATGWQLVGGNWYLLNNNGVMATGWQLVGGRWYLLKSNGAMATGWQQTNGKWYYLYSDGSMANATVIDGYKVDMTGAWIR